MGSKSFTGQWYFHPLHPLSMCSFQSDINHDSHSSAYARNESDADADGGEQGGDVPHVVCPGSFYL